MSALFTEILISDGHNRFPAKEAQRKTLPGEEGITYQIEGLLPGEARIWP